MEFAAAASLHPLAADAAGELIGQLLERPGRYPDVAVVLLDPSIGGAAEDVAAAFDRLLSATVLLCAVVPAPLGPLDARLSMAVWAARCGPAQLALESRTEAAFPPAGMLALGEIPAPRLPGVPVAGLVGNDVRVVPAGAGGVVFGPGAAIEAFAAPGWRPVGPPVTVTRADESMVYELDGEPALVRLTRVARDEVPSGEIPSGRPRFGLGGDTVWALRGADRVNGALAGARLHDGQTVRVWVDDPTVARAALEATMSEPPAAALVFAHPTARAGAVAVGTTLAAEGTAFCGSVGDGLVGPGAHLGGGSVGLRFGTL